jgi:hypothetical protein
VRVRSEVQVSVGALLLHVLNRWYTARATAGAFDDLAAALAAVLDCGAVASGVSSSSMAQAGLDLPTLHAFCVAATSEAVAPLTEALPALEPHGSLWLNGGARMVDDDANATVDRLVEGTWVGAVQTEGVGGASFDGTWEAVRVP